MAQSVEHVIGNDEVISSILITSSNKATQPGCFIFLFFLTLYDKLCYNTYRNFEEGSLQMEEKKPQGNPKEENVPQLADPKPTKPTVKKTSKPTQASASKSAEPTKSHTPAAQKPQPNTTKQQASKKWEIKALAKSLAEVFAPAKQIPTAPNAPAMADVKPQSANQAQDAAAASAEKPVADSKVKIKGFMIRPWQMIVAAVLAVSMIGGGVVLGVVLGKREADKLNSPFDDAAIDHNWTPPSGSAENQDGIVLPGYAYLIFPAGEKKVEILLPNPTGNPCHFQYEMMLVETGEVLYRSKLIAPGKAVPKIELARPLTEGTYTLRIKINTYSLADGVTPMNGGEQDVKLYVK